MKINGVLKTVALSCLAVTMLASAFARADDDETDKLEQLKRAVTAPSESTQPAKKHKTRAIVFDPTPDTDASQAASQAAAPQTMLQVAPHAGTGQVQAATDCSAPAPDAKITAVDFAIQFNVGSASLTAPSEKTLQQIAKILALSNNCILVEGHTDSAGNADRNLELSRQRADSVTRFITEAGIPKSRLVPVGKGSSEPLKNLDSRNPKNRRVVFKVVG